MAYFLPCLVLGLYTMCYIARLTRSSTLDALGQDSIKTARAKGPATPEPIFKHALRNDVIPVITYPGPLTAFQSGALDYTQNPPTDEVATLLVEGSLIPGDYPGTCCACFNKQKAPFDGIRVRQAFSLAIDRNFLAESVTQTGEIPVGARVPENVVDAGGTDGPTSREAGVNVTLNNQENVFQETCSKGDYSICRNGWIADCNDPVSFLDMSMTDNGNNDAHYKNPAGQLPVLQLHPGRMLSLPEGRSQDRSSFLCRRPSRTA